MKSNFTQKIPSYPKPRVFSERRRLKNIKFGITEAYETLMLLLL
tara:strand:+ start:533 stop:664 length:132 start_codon:yes stop_codon:yes gene_type:complete